MKGAEGQIIIIIYGKVKSERDKNKLFHLPRAHTAGDTDFVVAVAIAIASVRCVPARISSCSVKEVGPTTVTLPNRPPKIYSLNDFLSSDRIEWNMRRAKRRCNGKNGLNFFPLLIVVVCYSLTVFGCGHLVGHREMEENCERKMCGKISNKEKLHNASLEVAAAIAMNAASVCVCVQRARHESRSGLRIKCRRPRFMYSILAASPFGHNTLATFAHFHSVFVDGDLRSATTLFHFYHSPFGAHFFFSAVRLRLCGNGCTCAHH